MRNEHNPINASSPASPPECLETSRIGQSTRASSRSNFQEKKKKEISSSPALREAASERAVSRRRAGITVLRFRSDSTTLSHERGSFTNGLLTGMVTVIMGLEDKKLGQTGGYYSGVERAPTLQRTLCSGLR